MFLHLILMQTNIVNIQMVEMNANVRTHFCDYGIRAASAMLRVENSKYLRRR